MLISISFLLILQSNHFSGLMISTYMYYNIIIIEEILTLFKTPSPGSPCMWGGKLIKTESNSLGVKVLSQLNCNGYWLQNSSLLCIYQWTYLTCYICMMCSIGDTKSTHIWHHPIAICQHVSYNILLCCYIVFSAYSEIKQ